LFRQIGHKIIVVVGSVVATALLAILFFFTTHQERSILAQNERTMAKLTESVIEGLQTVMLAGYADIAQSYADRLKLVPEVLDFRIMRVNGMEAFQDNKTIDEVNERRGDEEFELREQEKSARVLQEDDANLLKTLAGEKIISFYERDKQGARYLTFLAPIRNADDCHKCHGGESPIRGLVKLTTSLGPVEDSIAATRGQALAVMIGMLILIIVATGILIRRSVVRHIDSVTGAMARVSEGDLSQTVPEYGRDELSRMAVSFNRMSKQLRQTYKGLESEQDKLTTIILSSREGIVVTDGNGTVVMTNPAVHEFLGKTHDQIVTEGFLNLFDDPELIIDHLERTVGAEGEADLHNYNDRTLSLYAATIMSEDGNVIGSAALIRDITEQKRLENELRKLSTTDGLTGLANRRFMDESLTEELDRTRRYELEMSVLMFDVDHFKKFNDEYGHDQGDRVLQTLADVMRSTVRDVDLPCRYGGEEFLIILPNTPVDGALLVAERLRESVANTIIDGLHVTISIGVATYPLIKADSADELVEAADAALYEAKRSGRNRVRRAQQSAKPSDEGGGDNGTDTAATEANA
jgi:diguanylate cyclase (GGDEF)-like protein/PAS domain S-box-containing protein